MFHLYFGAFDLLLYLGGSYFALVLANAICDQMDATEATQATTSQSQTKLAPMQPMPSDWVAPSTKREAEVGVKLSLH
ncbi:MAG TPA: hypothetical protein IGR64_09835 [Leptolyngbyaceae cyanobacterium M65_K2018_010]|nr:hypothetical protein [Leptolyngbyaceae cyanobacterium M65_K2018_010]